MGAEFSPQVLNKTSCALGPGVAMLNACFGSFKRQTVRACVCVCGEGCVCVCVTCFVLFACCMRRVVCDVLYVVCGVRRVCCECCVLRLPCVACCEHARSCLRAF